MLTLNIDTQWGCRGQNIQFLAADDSIKEAANPLSENHFLYIWKCAEGILTDGSMRVLIVEHSVGDGGREDCKDEKDGSAYTLLERPQIAQP